MGIGGETSAEEATFMVQERKESEEEVFYLYRERPSLERLSQTHVRIDDLIYENLKKLERALPDKKSEEEGIKQSKLRLEIEGLAITLTAYKVKNLQGGSYFEGGRTADNYIEIRYLSNLLKGINRTISSKRKKPREVRDLLYNTVMKVMREDNHLSKKEISKLDPKGRFYNSIAQRFLKVEEDKKLNELKKIGRILDGTKAYNTRKNIENELAKYHKLPQERIEAMEIRLVARSLIDEEEKIRYMLSTTLTDRFK